MFSLRNALIMVLVLIATGLGVWVASAALTQVTAVYTIDEKDSAGFTNPVDDDCPVGWPCKVKSDLNAADESQPIPAITSISPTAFRGPSGTSIPNGTVVGRTHVIWYYNADWPLGSCSSSSTKIEDTQDFLDGGLKGEVANDGSIDALSDPTVWPTLLENDLRVKYLLITTGHQLLRRSVAVINAAPMGMQIPINLLSFDVSDGDGFAGLTLQGTYNVAVTSVPGISLPSTCTPLTSNSLLLGKTAASQTLLMCQAVGTHTMTTVLTREVLGALVKDATVDDTVSCSRGAVGGLAEFDPLQPDAAADGTSSSAPSTSLLAGLAAGGALLLAGGAWYARRRWVR